MAGVTGFGLSLHFVELLRDRLQILFVLRVIGLYVDELLIHINKAAQLRTVKSFGKNPAGSRSTCV